eukprot:216965_1
MSLDYTEPVITLGNDIIVATYSEISRNVTLRVFDQELVAKSKSVICSFTSSSGNNAFYNTRNFYFPMYQEYQDRKYYMQQFMWHSSEHNISFANYQLVLLEIDDDYNITLLFRYTQNINYTTWPDLLHYQAILHKNYIFYRHFTDLKKEYVLHRVFHTNGSILWEKIELCYHCHVLTNEEPPIILDDANTDSISIIHNHGVSIRRVDMKTGNDIWLCNHQDNIVPSLQPNYTSVNTVSMRSSTGSSSSKLLFLRCYLYKLSAFVKSDICVFDIINGRFIQLLKFTNPIAKFILNTRNGNNDLVIQTSSNIIYYHLHVNNSVNNSKHIVLKQTKLYDINTTDNYNHWDGYELFWMDSTSHVIGKSRFSKKDEWPEWGSIQYCKFFILTKTYAETAPCLNTFINSHIATYPLISNHNHSKLPNGTEYIYVYFISPGYLNAVTMSLKKPSMPRNIDKACDNRYNATWEQAYVNLFPVVKKWTHFVYFIADNNLDFHGVQDLNQMRISKSLSDINIVVYIDRCVNCTSESSISVQNIRNCNTFGASQKIDGIFNSAKLLQLWGEKEKVWCEIADFGEQTNSLLVSNVVGFTSLLKRFESLSEHFFLEFWDHGQAWDHFGEDMHKGNVSGKVIYNVKSFVNAIKNGLPFHIDILGIDACWEADNTPLYYISEANISKYYIGSERAEPLFGWDYTHFNGSADDAIMYAKAIIDSYVAQSEKHLNQAFTLGLFSIDMFTIFVETLDELIMKMTHCLQGKDYATIMSILRANSQTDVNKDMKLKDIGLFLNALVSERNKFFETLIPEMQKLSNDAITYYNNAIIYFRTKFDGVTERLTGVSFFWSYDRYEIKIFEQKNSAGAGMVHLGSFFTALNSNLHHLKDGILTNVCSSSTTSLPSSSDLIFHLWNFQTKNVVNKKMNPLFNITVDVTPYVEHSYMRVYIGDNPVIELPTDTQDIDETGTTKLVSYWNGFSVQFVINGTSDVIYLPSLYSCSPNIYSHYLCIIQSPIHIYDKYENKSKGYLQFEMTGIESTWEQTLNATLFRHKNGILGPVSTDEKLTLKVLTMDNINEMNEHLSWPNLPEHRFINIINSNQTAPIRVIVFAKDIFEDQTFLVHILVGNISNNYTLLISLTLVATIILIWMVFACTKYCCKFMKGTKKYKMFKRIVEDEPSESEDIDADQTTLINDNGDTDSDREVDSHLLEVDTFYQL